MSSANPQLSPPGFRGPDYCFVAETIRPGGKFQVMLEQMRVLLSRGDIVEVVAGEISPEITNDLASQGILVHPLRPYQGGSVTNCGAWFFRQRELVSNHIPNAAVVVNHTNLPQYFPRLRRCLHYVHRPPVARATSAYAHFVLGIVAGRPRSNQAGLVVANSRFTAEILHSQGWTSVAPAVLYPPVPQAPRVTSMRKQKMVLSLGLLTPGKNHHLLADLAKKMPDYCFVVAGRGQRPRYVAHLKGLARKIGNLEIEVDISSVRKRQLLETSEVLVHLKTFEHFGIAPVEAMAHGTRALAFDAGGPRETLPWASHRFKTVNELPSMIRTGECRQTAEYVSNARRFAPDIHRHGFEALLHDI